MKRRAPLLKWRMAAVGSAFDWGDFGRPAWMVRGVVAQGVLRVVGLTLHTTRRIWRSSGNLFNCWFNTQVFYMSIFCISWQWIHRRIGDRIWYLYLYVWMYECIRPPWYLHGLHSGRHIIDDDRTSSMGGRMQEVLYSAYLLNVYLVTDSYWWHTTSCNNILHYSIYDEYILYIHT